YLPPFESEPSLSCLGTITTSDDPASKVAALNPDVICIELHPYYSTGLDCLTELKLDFPVKVFIVDDLDCARDRVQKSFRRGAWDYLDPQYNYDLANVAARLRQRLASRRNDSSEMRLEDCLPLRTLVLASNTSRSTDAIVSILSAEARFSF